MQRWSGLWQHLRCRQREMVETRWRGFRAEGGAHAVIALVYQVSRLVILEFGRSDRSLAWTFLSVPVLPAALLFRPLY